MPRNPRDFRFIEEQLRKMTFGILSTVNPGGSLQTTGILYPHHFLRFVPASCISFPGTAEIVPEDGPEAREAFQSSRILRMNLEQTSSMENAVFIKIRPKRSIHCYGVGFGLMEIARDVSGVGYSVEVPSDRL
jgi:hypothetical protein